MGDGCEATVIHGQRQGAQGDGGDSWEYGKESPAGTMSEGSSTSSSLFSSTSSLTDDDEGDDATSSPPGRRPVSCSSSSSLTSSESSDKMHTSGAAAGGGPLYELSMMLDHLPALRTGLSNYYRGRSQSFTSLAEVSCVEDLAKKTTPYIKRTKAPQCYAAALGAKNHLSKKIAKKVKRSSPDRLLSRARSTSLLRSSGKPPAYHCNRELYRC
ncbi:hypothetical protein EJB05_41233 [Eragrostis curvula]|uniref:Oxidative stress 3 n=1 Tax=Eragrostis curvula TaxID=38414 RepID=A0A5J9TBA6_9POAL|nr:hypothetical protein EJB05_41233 [Eragrostis curvula]